MHWIPSLSDKRRASCTSPPAPIYPDTRRKTNFDICIEKRGSVFYCVPVIEFKNAIVDFEALTVSFYGSRYCLDGIAFSLVLSLLSAEGQFVSRRALIAMIGMPASPSGSAQLSRLVRRLREKMKSKNQENILEIKRESIRIIFNS